MAQLPPKVPGIAPTWPGLGHQRAPSMGPFGGQPSWVDEFLDFSSARRGSHRRSASDSVAFLEAPNDFDRLDEDQLMYMFSDDAPPNAASAPVSSSSPSSPSDHNSVNEEKIAAEPPEVQSECKVEMQAADANGSDTVVDPKRVKRYNNSI